MTLDLHPMVNGRACRCRECRDKLNAYNRARRAAGLEQRTKPEPRDCWRCGVPFTPHDHLTDDAPCKDCREFLRRVDHDTTSWDTRTRRKVAA